MNKIFVALLVVIMLAITITGVVLTNTYFVVLNWAGDTADGAVDGTGDAADEAADEAGEDADEAADGTGDAAGDAADEADGAVDGTGDAADEAGEDADGTGEAGGDADEAEKNKNDNKSDSIEWLTNNTKFNDLGLILKEIEESVELDKKTALKIAYEHEGINLRSAAKSTTAILTKITDTQIPVLPESDIMLNNLPVWIVTYHGITVNPRFSDDIIMVDTSVIIDAQSGEILETITYNAE